MSLALLNPAALAALLALAVPLLLHLIRRPQQRMLDFAAMRWIAATQRPQRRLVFEERLLLATRLLLLTLLALLLAVPVLQSRAVADAWVAVVPGADLAAARTRLDDASARWVWLAPGFPDVAQSMPGPGPNASLLRELDATLPPGTPLSVVVPETLAGLDGARLALGRDVAWHVAGDPAARGNPERAVQPSLAVRFPADREPATRYLAAAVAAWQLDAPDTASIDTLAGTAVPPADADTLVWLHPGPLPRSILDWVDAGRTLVIEPDLDRSRDGGTDAVGEDARAVAWRSADGDTLARVGRIGRGRVVQLQQALEPDALSELLDPAFPSALLALLAHPVAPDAAPASAHPPRRADRATAGRGPDPGHRPLFAWLAIAIALLLLAERLLATRRTRCQS